MIEIINKNNITLDLPENFVLTIERNNPLFNKANEFFQDITYPGKAELTPNNKMFIGSGHLLESSIYKYEFHVDVFINGNAFFSGMFAYKIVGKEINFTLKVTYGGVATLSDNTFISEISYPDDPVTSGSFPHLDMQDTLVNPANWPMAFFPIHHDTFKEADGEPIEYWSNPFDLGKGEKYEWKENDPKPWRDVPHYKLSYVLKGAMEHIGLKATGNFFEETRTKSLYIVNDQYKVHRSWKAKFVLPAISISELLKALKERFRLNIGFDLTKKIAVFDVPNTFLKSDNYVDISDCVADVFEIEGPERRNYSIYAKNTDEFNSPYYISINDDSDDSLPEEKLEVAISTLPVELFPSETTPVLSGYTFPYTRQPYPGDESGPFRQRPANLGTDNIGRVRSDTPTPIPRSTKLILLSYSGLVEEEEKLYPKVQNVPFTLEDGEYYAFLNDSKKVKVVANIPPHILSRIDPYTKIAFTSREGVLVHAVIKQIEYSVSSKQRELIRVEIEAFVNLNKYSKIALVELPPEVREDGGTRPPRS